jgi:beta-1,4-mannosyltransferase
MWETAWNILIAFALAAIVIGLLLLLTLPTTYSHLQAQYITEDFFPDGAKKDAQKSGYAYFTKYKDSNGRYKVDTSVQIVVLGDIGRSPRMQYHALSLAKHGALVSIIGYAGAEVHPDITRSRLINTVPIKPFPSFLQGGNKLTFLLLAPLKVLWQVASLYHALGYSTPPSKWMLIQNPPSIPLLALAQLICFLRSTRLVIDWHNFGYSILALRLGYSHPLVRFSEWYEGFFASHGVHSHFAVTNAMCKVLKQKWDIDAMPLHDRPPEIFQPLSGSTRTRLLERLPGTAAHAADILAGRTRLLISSTSWTPDEDFSVLLDALVRYSTAVDADPFLPNVVAIITGRGPQRDYYLSRIQTLTSTNQLAHVIVTTAWLSPEDYALLLGSADLGVSLHTSSSGVDLPMKVVDMFGTGLPVAGWSKFEAWPELVQEGKNGLGFESAKGLKQILVDVFGGDGERLLELRRGAMKECKRRWDDEWMPVAGRLFQLRS